MQRSTYFYALAVVVGALCGMFFLKILVVTGLDMFETVAVTTAVSAVIAIVVTIVMFTISLNPPYNDEGNDVSFVRVVVVILIVPCTVFLSLLVSSGGNTPLGIGVAILGVVLLSFLGHVHNRVPFLNRRIKLVSFQ